MAEREETDIVRDLVQAARHTGNNSIQLLENSGQKIRAAEANEMLERTPSWLMRWGMFSVVGVFALLFGIAAFIKYPDTIEGKAIITTDPLPIQLKATIGGRIANLFATAGWPVKAGNPIAEIENNTGYSYIEQLMVLTDSAANYLKEQNTIGFQSLVQHPMLSLGEGQSFYNTLLQNISAYILLKEARIYTRREGNLQQQKIRYSAVSGITKTEARLIDEELKQSGERFKSNEKLYQDKVISKMEYYEEAAKLRQHKLALEAQRKTSLQNTITMGDNNKQLLDMQYDKAEKEQTLHIAIEESIRNLQNFIQTWKRQYLLIAPYDGKLLYLRPLQLNEIVAGGDLLFTVIPLTFRNTAVINVPPTGLGKVQIGQSVHLQLGKYPYQEYGYLEGKIITISDLPTTINTTAGAESVYQIRVALPETLVTSYHKIIPFSPEMAAEGRIITKDRSLLQRLVSGVTINNR